MPPRKPLDPSQPLDLTVKKTSVLPQQEGRQARATTATRRPDTYQRMQKSAPAPQQHPSQTHPSFELTGTSATLHERPKVIKITGMLDRQYYEAAGRLADKLQERNPEDCFIIDYDKSDKKKGEVYIQRYPGAFNRESSSSYLDVRAIIRNGAILSRTTTKREALAKEDSFEDFGQDESRFASPAPSDFGDTMGSEGYDDDMAAMCAELQKALILAPTDSGSPDATINYRDGIDDMDAMAAEIEGLLKAQETSRSK